MSLPLHRFGVGQSVEFIGDRRAAHSPAGRFTVQKQLPNDQLDREYLLRGAEGGGMRVARETELREVRNAHSLLGTPPSLRA